MGTLRSGTFGTIRNRPIRPGADQAVHLESALAKGPEVRSSQVHWVPLPWGSPSWTAAGASRVHAVVSSRMTTLDDLRAHVGADLFAEAQRWAWETAAGTGGWADSGEWPDSVEEVPHSLADLVWFNTNLSPTERVNLLFELYREMPCYANLLYILLGELDPEALDLFWSQVRDLLDDPDERLADPVSYWLWCGPFEDKADVSVEVWERIVTGGALGDHAVERILGVAGPVPWHAKAPLLRKLLPDPRWHESILGCIGGSVFDLYGRVDIEEARSILDRLELNRNGRKMARRVRKAVAGRRT